MSSKAYLPSSTSSDQNSIRPAMQRLDQQAFPHPPQAGTSHLKPTIENVEHLLTESGFRSRYNVIKKRLDLREADGAATSMNQIASAAMLNGMGTGWLYQFVEEVGHRNPVNPIKDWMLSSPWDGIDQLPALYYTVLTSDDYPEGLKEALLYRWLLSVTVAAIKDGPVALHGVLTLQGDQGTGKTSWVGRLLPSTLSADYIKLDHHLDGGNKDSIIGCITHFIVEIGELDSSFKKDVARLKGFLTSDCDKLRKPYGREEIEMPRKTVFAATVNDDRFLVDATGNRRWWTIAVRGLNFKHEIDMQQLYAQLAVAYHEGEQWWLTSAESRQLAAYNQQHRTVSAICERISDHLDHEMIGYAGGQAMTAIEVLNAIGVGNPTNAQCKEAGSVLRELLGSPKRIQGRDRWRIHARTPSVTSWTEPTDQPVY